MAYLDKAWVKAQLHSLKLVAWDDKPVVKQQQVVGEVAVVQQKRLPSRHIPSSVVEHNRRPESKAFCKPSASKGCQGMLTPSTPRLAGGGGLNGENIYGRYCNQRDRQYGQGTAPSHASQAATCRFQLLNKHARSMAGLAS